MIWIFVFLAFLVAGIILRINYSKLKEIDDWWISSSLFWKSLILPAIILVIGFVQPIRVTRVETGHLGLKFKLVGDQKGISKYSYESGWVFYNSWIEDIYKFPTNQQHIEYDSLPVITKGGFPTVIKPTFNYSLKPETMGDMWQNLRADIREV